MQNQSHAQNQKQGLAPKPQTPKPIQRPVPQARKSQQDLDDELKRIARAKKFGDSMDTT